MPLINVLERIAAGEQVRVVVHAPPRHSKLCADSTPVLTPKGWTTHGELRVGDHVFAPDGTPTRILRVTEKQLATVEVRFTDGASVKVNPQHRWTVWDRNGKTFRVLETQEMVGKLFLGLNRNETPRFRFQVDFTQPLQLPERQLPIDPYFLGLWLGDGTSMAALLCGAGPDLETQLQRLSKRGFFKPSRRFIHATTGVHYAGFADGMYTALRVSGVLGNKHIPEIYFRGSIEQRRDLLRGLVDTDGHVCPETGRVRIVGVNKRLIEQAGWMANTLGYRTTITQQTPAVIEGAAIQGKKVAYTVQWTPHDGEQQAFLPRKDHRVSGHRRRRSVSAIVPCEPEPGHCIEVEHSSHLYLVGRELVPTHNTETCIHSFPWLLDQRPEFNIGYCSYNSEIAVNKSLRARDIADRIGLQLKSRSGRHWQTVQGGGVFSTGIRGSATGYGFDLGLIDDSTKNRKEAESATMRQDNWDWFTDVFLKRLSPRGSAIVMGARWHPDDLSGRVISKLGWEYIRLPAISEDENGNERALWPEFWSLEAMQLRRRQSGVYTWESLEQGNPRPRGGSVFGEPSFYKPEDLPKRFRLGGGVDLAYTKKTSADYSVASVLYEGLDDSGFVYVKDVKRQQVRAPEFMGTLRMLKSQYPGIRFRFYASGIERGSADFIKDFGGVSLEVMNPNGDKFTRAIPYAAAWNDHKILLPEIADEHDDAGNRIYLPDENWTDRFIVEHSNFTGVDDENDDQVDATASAFDELRNGVFARARALAE